MKVKESSKHSQWSSRFAFIMASTGSAVGLGNIWKFPYVAGENGGAPFILIYLLFVFFIGLPIMISEIMLGRHGKRSTIGIFSYFHKKYGTSIHWQFIGAMGILTGILIFSFYSVISGWLLFYLFQYLTGSFQGADAQSVTSIFNGLIASPGSMLLWHGIFILLTAVVFIRDINAGIGKLVTQIVPLLLLLMIAIIIYNIYNADMRHALSFMFSFDWNKIDSNVIIIALAHAFFSLSLGMGAIMIYGSYLSHRAPLMRTAATIVTADTLSAILAGLMIFPILFQLNLAPEQGPGLVFKTLPVAFAQMPGGMFVGILFFFLLFIAAWTSALSLFEPAVAWLVERYTWTRAKAAIWIGSLVWVLGFATAFSFNIWKEVKVLEMTAFEWIDSLATKLALPLGGILIVVFSAWYLPDRAYKTELPFQNNTIYRVWRVWLRYFCPAILLLVLISGWMH